MENRQSKYSPILAILLNIILATIISCQPITNESPTLGSLQITINDSLLDKNEQIAFAYLSIENEDNSLKYDNLKVQLYTNDAGFESEIIELPQGDYLISDAIFTNSSQELILLAPKCEYKYFKKLPIHTSIEKSCEFELNIEAVSLKKYNLKPKDLGYNNIFNNTDSKTTEIEDFICLQIGINNTKSVFKDTLKFRLTNDDEILIDGKYSKGISQFDIPKRESNYTLIVESKNGEIVKSTFSIDELKEYNCENNEYINLLNYIKQNKDSELHQTPETQIENHGQIYYVKQKHIAHETTAEIEIVDENGNIFSGKSAYWIPDSTFSENIIINKDLYKKIYESVQKNIGQLDSDTLKLHHNIFTAEKLFRFSFINFDPRGAEYQIWAIYPYNDQYLAVLMDSENKPPQTIWRTFYFNEVLKWFTKKDFYKDDFFSNTTF